ncbi:MAG: 3'(2'),5'-bisphosphate nucleotidase CysQ [Gammaproteobacteria bacterium]|nr:3'(2'),5'-bisphosphate nucleotidase CysQ [Gammaproteobacteria bacterium]
MSPDNGFLKPLDTIARQAGKAILDVYETDFDVELKGDDSPLTQADLAAHRIIVRGLQELTPDIPILSEESADIPWGERRHWGVYWLVDPLDGTKEFIKKNGEFTVNIALVENGVPITGVVHVPVSGVSYLGVSAINGETPGMGSVGGGAFKVSEDSQHEIRVKMPHQQPPRVVASRSHRGEAVEGYLASLGEHEVVSMGSSLKICLVAEGAADVYPRLGPTSEWDTAAAHAVLLAAGGELVDATSGKPLVYNAKETLLNPWFIAYGDTSVDWQAHAG